MFVCIVIVKEPIQISFFKTLMLRCEKKIDFEKELNLKPFRFPANDRHIIFTILSAFHHNRNGIFVKKKKEGFRNINDLFITRRAKISFNNHFSK